MAEILSILVVDDDRYDNDRYCRVLRSFRYEVLSTLDAHEALMLIEQRRFDVVLLDMLLPLRLQGKTDFGGLELLRRIRATDKHTQIIAVTGYGSRELAAEAMGEGAFDYITKDLDTEDRLPGSVRVAGARAQTLRLAAEKNPDTSGQEATLPSNLIADSTAMRQTIRRAQRFASIDGSLLITGESGSGKELVARVVHLNSQFADGPFVVVACRSLSASLVELWGDTSPGGSGFCRQAEGGTLLLKNIHDLPFTTQQHLVPLLRDRRYHRVGSSEEHLCNLRIIATTTADLERLIRQGRMYRALYDQLNVATLDVPPLRERRDKDDILAIAGYILHRYGLAGGISPSAATLLSTYDYKQGNVKELESILRNAAAEAGGAVIQPEHLPPDLRSAVAQSLPAMPTSPSHKEDHVLLSVRFIVGEEITLLWESDVGGSARSQMHFPFHADDLDLIHRSLNAAQWREQYWNRPTFTDSEIERLTHLGLWANNNVVQGIEKQIGLQIYQAMIADPEAKSAFETATRLAAQERRPLNLILRFPPQATDLAGLPWELLSDGKQSLLLSHSKLTSCIRYLEIPQALRPQLPFRQQLRLLVVSPQEGVSDELFAEEQKLLIDALKPHLESGHIVIEELRPVLMSDITDRLINGDPVDILQFYGHGRMKQGGASIILDNGELDASQLAALVGDIPLVVLFACGSGETGRDSIFTGIAPMLSAEGIPTVIAMQYAVPIKAANCFLSFLYRSLARGESVQVAVAKARQALYAEHRDSWYLPVIYIRSPDTSPVVLIRK